MAERCVVPAAVVKVFTSLTSEPFWGPYSARDWRGANPSHADYAKLLRFAIAQAVASGELPQGTYRLRLAPCPARYEKVYEPSAIRQEPWYVAREGYLAYDRKLQLTIEDADIPLLDASRWLEVALGERQGRNEQVWRYSEETRELSRQLRRLCRREHLNSLFNDLAAIYRPDWRDRHEVPAYALEVRVDAAWRRREIAKGMRWLQEKEKNDASSAQ